MSQVHWTHYNTIVLYLSQLQALSQVNVTKNNSGKILEELSNITTSDDLSATDLNISLSIFEKIVQKDAINARTKNESKLVGQV